VPISFIVPSPPTATISSNFSASAWAARSEAWRGRSVSRTVAWRAAAYARIFGSARAAQPDLGLTMKQVFSGSE
jgi:hypothetical protein